jgi:pimeloyl-ACP methyl ester carboxylesterase
MRYVAVIVLLAGASVCGLAGPSRAVGTEPTVGEIRVAHRHGQTFVTWKDLAAGEDGAKVRYSVYRSDRPITADNLKRAELCGHGILNNSARLFGTAFKMKDLLDATKPYSVIEEGGKPLPPWSGLAVHTVRKDGKAYYAVVATDDKLSAIRRIVPGKSATIDPIEEKAAPMQPIKLFDSKSRGIYSPQTSITGTKGLPLRVELHASQGQGGGAGDYGDYYLYFATPDMGYRDGLPGVFSVEERREKSGNYLLLRGREAIEHPSGARAMETFWFGYFCVPQYSSHAEPRAYPFTERRQDWIIDWVVKKYAADPERITAAGGSMGAWGSATYALRRPDRFAAVYPNRPRTRQRGLPSLAGMIAKGKDVLMDDGKTDYFTRMDMVKFAAEHSSDLPFFGWCCGRRDGFASWQEQIDMVKAMTAARHGFAFAWNDGDHSSGAQPMAKIAKYYSPDKFTRNRSYPAFSNSSIDQKLGNGDPKDGDLEGGVNLGFLWKDLGDEERRWTVRLANDLAKGPMTVDVTPRRCQRFKAPAGSDVSWTTSTGAAGKAVVNRDGIVTIPGVELRPDVETLLTISR